jgi:hypothetical protein
MGLDEGVGGQMGKKSRTNVNHTGRTTYWGQGYCPSVDSMDDSSPSSFRG